MPIGDLLLIHGSERIDWLVICGQVAGLPLLICIVWLVSRLLVLLLDLWAVILFAVGLLVHHHGLRLGIKLTLIRLPEVITLSVSTGHVSNRAVFKTKRLQMYGKLASPWLGSRIVELLPCYLIIVFSWSDAACYFIDVLLFDCLSIDPLLIGWTCLA